MTNAEKFIEVFGTDLKRQYATKSWWDQEFVPPKTGRWIPVSERLPEEDAKVLTTIKWKDGSKYVGIDSIVGGKWMLNIPEDGDTTIAWMPLPKPYDPQESEEHI